MVQITHKFYDLDHKFKSDGPNLLERLKVTVGILMQVLLLSYNPYIEFFFS